MFIRVKSEEWNVYRRYAEFREFHQQIQRYLPDASTFNFPPKKTVGRKVHVRILCLINFPQINAIFFHSHGTQTLFIYHLVTFIVLVSKRTKIL